MELSDFYPSPKQLVDSELSVLDYLRRSPYIQRTHPQVATAAAQYYPQYKGRHSGLVFDSHFDVWHAPMRSREPVSPSRGKPRPNARLIVSARIDVLKNDFKNVTYCLSVFRIRATHPQERVNILRKFHFDVAVGSPPGSARLQQHPRCHLQYCGKMVPYMETVGARTSQLDQMHPLLSEPRILFWPMSLALLIDMALHEFPDQDSAKFRSDSYWRGLVRKQEALVLCPFYEKCVEIIKDAGEQNLTLADAFYTS